MHREEHRAVALLKFVATACLFLLPTQITSAQQPESDCMSDRPVLDLVFPSVPLGVAPIHIGEWRLPLSSNKIGTLTEARLRIDLSQSPETGAWQADILVSFPDPKPYGIPYSFQKITLDWTEHAEPQAASIDWTYGCSGPGRSLFPGQSWRTTLALPSSESLFSLDDFIIRLWGSRN
jgi:hypothetical protein